MTITTTTTEITAADLAALTAATFTAVQFVRIGLVCEECALVIEADDTTALTAEREEVIRVGIGAIRVDVGTDLVVLDPEQDGSVTFRCGVCGDDVMGPAQPGVVAVDLPM